MASLPRKGVLSVLRGASEWLPGRGGRVGWRPGTECVPAASGLLLPTDELVAAPGLGCTGLHPDLQPDPPRPTRWGVRWVCSGIRPHGPTMSGRWASVRLCGPSEDQFLETPLLGSKEEARIGSENLMVCTFSESM